MVPLGAVFANTVDPKGVSGGEIVVLAADLLLEPTDLLGKNSTELPQSVQTMW